MRRISALWESFFSKNLYTEVFYSWKGIGFLSLLLLVMIQTGIIFAQIHLGLHGFVYQAAPSLVQQVPPITFKEGKASTPEPIAYEIKAPGNGGVVAIIDTRVPHPPADLGGAQIFLAGESITMTENDNERRSYGYSRMGSRTVDQKVINYWLDILAVWGAVICAPFIFGFFLVWRLIQLLVFSLVTLAACAMQGLPGDYAAKLRLTAMALIPPIIAGMFLFWVTNFYLYLLLFSAVVTGYIFFGVNAARTSGDPAESGSETPPPIPQ